MLCGPAAAVTIFNPDLINRNHCGSTATPMAAITSGLRGWPLARRTIRPPSPSTKTVGVRRTLSCRTRSSRDSASISMWLTPSVIPATSARIRRVARHGAQNADENCTSVARSPRACPSWSLVRMPLSAGTDAAGTAAAGTVAAGTVAAGTVAAGTVAAGIASTGDDAATRSAGPARSGSGPSPSVSEPASPAPWSTRALSGCEAPALARPVRGARGPRIRPFVSRQTVPATRASASAPTSAPSPGVIAAISAPAARRIPGLAGGNAHQHLARAGDLEAVHGTSRDRRRDRVPGLLAIVGADYP
jgi:hypothetical protein